MERVMTRRQMAALMAAGAASLILGGCSGASSQQQDAATSAATASQTPSEPQAVTELSPDSNVMVLYYSLPEATSAEDMTPEGENSTVTVNGEVLGNVQFLAQLIGQQTGAEPLHIVATEPYPIEDHQQLIDQAKEELDSGYRPEVTGAPTSQQIEAADVVFLGYPIWWADLPTPVYTLLESVDLTGKTVIPFTCHGGSGFANTRATLAELQPGADVRGEDGFSVSRDVVADSAGDVTAWLASLGFGD